jgi:hypothetical protein
MTDFLGWVDNAGKVVHVTDLNGCYGDNGKCYCADCFYYGAGSVNCQNAGNTDGSVPVKWDDDNKKWVVVA